MKIFIEIFCSHFWKIEELEDKILNNIIEITPLPGLLTRSQTCGQYIAPRCRINGMVFSFYYP